MKQRDVIFVVARTIEMMYAAEQRVDTIAAADLELIAKDIYNELQLGSEGR